MAAAEIFESLCLKLDKLLCGTNQAKSEAVFPTLDQLNCLNFSVPTIFNEVKACRLIHQFCTSLDHTDERLTQLCMQLITKLIVLQHIPVDGTTLNLSVRWCLQAATSPNKALVLDALLALEALVRKNGHNIPWLLDLIVQHAKEVIECDGSTQPQELLLVAVYKCLEASTDIPSDIEPSESLDQHFADCQTIFISHLCNNPAINSSVAANKVSVTVIGLMKVRLLIESLSQLAETCLQGLNNLVHIQAASLQQELGLILGIVRSYMVCGIKGIEFSQPVKLTPTVLNLPQKNQKSAETTGGAKPRRRKYRFTKKKEKKVDNEVRFVVSSDRYNPATIRLDYNSDLGMANFSGMGLTTSDSDFSDANDARRVNLGHSCSCVRQAALALFCSIIKHEDAATVFTYWSSFMPESATADKHNLLSCCLLDPTSKGKVCALNVLLGLITRSKTYLASAESKEKTASFTSFSAMLGLTLIELNAKLCLSLSDRSVGVLTHALKCLAVLAQNTPYHRMAPGLITKIVRNVKPLVSFRDHRVQVTALVVLGSLLMNEPPLPETQRAIFKLEKEPEARPERPSLPAEDEEYFAQFSSDEEEPEAGTSDDSMSWLLHKCLRNLGVMFDNAPAKLPVLPVQLEALQVLSAMSRNYFETMMLMHLNYIVRALEMSLACQNEEVALHAARLIEFLGDAMGKVGEAAGTSQCLTFWPTLLNCSEKRLFQSENPVLRAVGCDCLASISPWIWKHLPRNKQVLCIMLLFDCSKDEQGAVRSAAARALSVCTLHQSLQEDEGFIVDATLAILENFQDTHPIGRLKTSWSLGCLSDSLVLIHSAGQGGIPDAILLRLLRASVEGLSDRNYKVQSNVGRTLGNLLQLLDEKRLEDPQIQKVGGQAIEALVQTCGTSGTQSKARWNACYALANALQNPALFERVGATNWQGTVFSTLGGLVVGCKNFKVRINAALALSAPRKREHYGTSFIPLWAALLQALDQSQTIEDLAEYKHRDQLVEQICLCLGHLATLLQKVDLSPLEDRLAPAADMLQMQVRRVLDRLVPEKSGDLVAATSAISVLESNGNIYSAAEQRVLACLKTVFVTQ
ncbi:hypothetical protein HUJ04_008893 [Dendroctonus ponderosae]|nr:hypothetical protein HUJ04_008893 [Dendroctonus ponderosae]